MSRLDIYKKQAKQLVRWHREGNYSIGGRIRGLARYQTLTDRRGARARVSTSRGAGDHRAGGGLRELGGIEGRGCQ